MKSIIKRAFRQVGLDIHKAEDAFRQDYEAFERSVIERVTPYTMTTHEKIVGVIDAVQYIVKADIPGAIVECGVWRGGSMMAAALTLLDLGAHRDLCLFDTFEGMTAPTEHDRKASSGESALPKFTELKTEAGSDWCYASIEDVRVHIESTGYPMDRVRLIKGPVESTIPANSPDEISILRLDTDFYESTRHELIHLFPRLARRGVLILDDYGSWEGARKAADEYFAQSPILLVRTDFSGRMTIKP